MSENKNDSRADETATSDGYNEALKIVEENFKHLNELIKDESLTDFYKGVAAEMMVQFRQDGNSHDNNQTPPLQEQLEKLQEENKDCDGRNTDLWALLKSSQEETSLLRSQLEEAKDLVQYWKDYSSDFHRQLEEKDREIADLQKFVEEQKIGILDAYQEIERLKGGRGNEKAAEQQDFSSFWDIWTEAHKIYSDITAQGTTMQGVDVLMEKFKISRLSPPSLHDPSFKTPNNQ